MRKSNAKNLNIKAWMFAIGLMNGLYLFISTILVMYKINTVCFSITTFSILQTIYPGLVATIQGAFIGLAYGIAKGAICAGIFVLLHNFIAKRFK